MKYFSLSRCLITVIKFATLNVRGTGSTKKKLIQIQRSLLDLKFDILAVQETNLAWDEAIGRALESFLPHYEVLVSHAVAISGVCFFFCFKEVVTRNSPAHN